jgi:hypothetical protein
MLRFAAKQKVHGQGFHYQLPDRSRAVAGELRVQTAMTDIDNILFIRACLFWAATFLIGRAVGSAIYVRFFLKQQLERSLRAAVLEIQQRINVEK